MREVISDDVLGTARVRQVQTIGPKDWREGHPGGLFSKWAQMKCHSFRNQEDIFFRY